MCTYFPIQFFIWQVSWLFCFKLTRSRIHKPKHKHFLKKGNIYHLHLQAQVRIHCITNYFMHYHTSFSLSSQNYYEIQIKYELYIVQMDPATLLFLRSSWNFLDFASVFRFQKGNWSQRIRQLGINSHSPITVMQSSLMYYFFHK